MSTNIPSKPTVLSYCSTFLKKETLHIYRQIDGLKNYNAHVLTRHIENAEQFPFSEITELKKDPLRFLNRFFWKTLRKQRVPLTGYEIRQIQHLADDVDASLIHIYLGTEAARLLPYLKKERRPKIISFHGVDTSDALEQRDLEMLLECTDLFLVRSESLKKALVDRGCPADRIRLNPTGVPIPGTYVDKKAPDFGSGQPVRMLQACRFVEKKGLDVTVDAVAELKRKNIAVQLDLAGSGPCEGALREQVQRLGLGNEVRFLGFMKNDALLASMPSYHLFLHPSRTTVGNDREGIPNSLLEAMACGIPCIATRHSGIPEAVIDGENGILLDTLSAHALAGAVEKVTANKAHYLMLSKQARKTVVEKFSTEHNIECLEESYDALMNKQGNHE